MRLSDIPAGYSNESRLYPTSPLPPHRSLAGPRGGPRPHLRKSHEPGVRTGTPCDDRPKPRTWVIAGDRVVVAGGAAPIDGFAVVGAQDIDLRSPASAIACSDREWW